MLSILCTLGLTRHHSVVHNLVLNITPPDTYTPLRSTLAPPTETALSPSNCQSQWLLFHTNTHTHTALPANHLHTVANSASPRSHAY